MSDEWKSESEGTPRPVISVGVANKGLMLDAARVPNAGLKAAVFSVGCGWLVRVAMKGLSGGS